MEKYPKIESVFNRDPETGKFIMNDWRRPEFAYLADNTWVCHEKVDGTNIRVHWPGWTSVFPQSDERVHFAGRTDRASIPAFLYEKLSEIFTWDKFSGYSGLQMTLYGEGYGARIQKGGGKYIPDGVNFVLFDVKVGDWWLRLDDVDAIARALEIETVPEVMRGTLHDAVALTRKDITSRWGDFSAEGLVCRPVVQLFNRKGSRIITKMKGKDF